MADLNYQNFKCLHKHYTQIFSTQTCTKILKKKKYFVFSIKQWQKSEEFDHMAYYDYTVINSRKRTGYIKIRL